MNNDDDNDEDTVESPTARLSSHPEGHVLHLAQYRCVSAESPETSDPDDVEPQGEDDRINSNDDEDELLHSPEWYRFGSSTATIESANTTRDASHPYVARVKDAWLDREFHAILGMEFVGDELHYLVEFTPILMRASVVRDAQAQPLINRFEAQCQVQTKRQRDEGHQLHEPEALDDRLPRKRRGRPRQSI